MFIEMFLLLLKPLLETVYMVLMSTVLASLVGIPLGFLLLSWRTDGLWLHRKWYAIFSALINAWRSIPFIILLIALIPVTRLLVGVSIGANAAIVSLSFAAIPFVARLTESALQGLSEGFLTAGFAMGATPWQIITRFLWPEVKVPLIKGITLTAINLVAYSAMAGAVGGGGLGDLAIRYGYQRFNIPVMLCTIAVLILLVQAIQWLGDKISLYFQC